MTTLVEKQSLNISFAATIDEAGALQLRYDGKKLSDYNGGLVVGCDSTETVTFQLDGFRHADKHWSVQGAPWPSQPEVNASWTIDRVAGIMTAAVEVTMTASADGEAPKKQKIFIKTKPRTDLPDDQMG